MMAGWFYGPSVNDQLRGRAKDLETERRRIERSIGDKRAEAEDARTRAANALSHGRRDEARAHFGRVVAIQRQVAQLERTNLSLMQAGSQIEDASAVDLMSRAVESAANALSAADRRMPGAKVQADALRMDKAKARMAAKRETMDEALASEDADDEEDVSNGGDQLAIDQMMDIATVGLLPGIGAAPGVFSPAAAADVADLPQLRPLNSGGTK